MTLPRLILALLLVSPALFAQQAPNKEDLWYAAKQVLEFNCVNCHQESKDKGDLRLDTKALAFEGGENDECIIPGKPDDSSLYYLTTYEEDEDEVMPPMKKKTDYLMTKHEQAALRDWIAAGAYWPEDETLVARKRLPEKIDFVEHVQEILETRCVSCHQESKVKGELRIDTYAEAMKGGENGDCFIPGKPLQSSFYTLTTLHPDDDDIMPPKGDPLTPTQIYIMRRWIEDGLAWPKDITLVPKKVAPKTPVTAGLKSSEIFTKLGFDKLAATAVDKPYTQDIPGISVTFDMVPIPAGKFTMGSPDSEAKRLKDEGPQREVSIDAFWFGKHEVLWAEYEAWKEKHDVISRKEDYKPSDLDAVADAVSRATPPYQDMAFGMGQDSRPAICMTQLAAKVYCMWLSAKTGHFYRLPTEAEWEYACRAGTTTAYHFGDDVKELDKYGWHYGNCNFQYQPVGQKLPNPWGLYDMHGNVSEWVLDAYDDGYYAKGGTNNPINPPGVATDTPSAEIEWPTQLYPRLVRGGSWYEDAEYLRSAARYGSEPSWKTQDPQVPKSVWYHTDAKYVGFRVVRPAKPPALADLAKYWPSDEEIKAIPLR
jgi:formylglycine-generating enzyme required for sulfatase activity/mono/diheme cytochrome c family protein